MKTEGQKRFIRGWSKKRKEIEVFLVDNENERLNQEYGKKKKKMKMILESVLDFIHRTTSTDLKPHRRKKKVKPTAWFSVKVSTRHGKQYSNQNQLGKPNNNSVKKRKIVNILQN